MIYATVLVAYLWLTNVLAFSPGFVYRTARNSATGQERLRTDVLYRLPIRQLIPVGGNGIVVRSQFLESEPYWDRTNIPLHTFKAKEPHIGKIVSVNRIVGDNAIGDVCNVVIDHFGQMPFREGQSFGVIPPGVNPKNGKPHPNRLYSAASTRYGDDMKGNTVTLCVRKSTYIDPLTNHEDHSKKGICSSFLCDAKVGDLVHLTGPTGKTMLLSETPPTTDIILVATGTGVAPFRSFLRRLFVEDTPAARDFQGFAWLFLGAANQDSLLYADEWQRLTKEFPDRFRWTYALSREERNAIGGKMYIQDKLEFHANEIFARMERGAHLYFCGLRGMMPGIMATLERAAVMKGQVWSDVLKQWKEQGKWHVEVY